MASHSETLFEYPTARHTHRHGPGGYKNHEDYKPWLRDEFTFTCAYCLVRERWQRGGHRHFSVEHVAPQSTSPHRKTDYTNLIYACVDCNSLRQDRPVLDPFSAVFAAHLRVMADGKMEGLSAVGKAHIAVLRLDSEELTEYRKQILETARLIEQDTGASALSLLYRWLGFPDDLPNLAAKRPPGGNTSPKAARNCYYLQRQNGNLPDHY